jgi:hypothetical protein
MEDAPSFDGASVHPAARSRLTLLSDFADSKAAGEAMVKAADRNDLDLNIALWRAVLSVVALQTLVHTNGDLKGGPDGSRGVPTARIIFVCSSSLQASIICAGHVADRRDLPRIRF